MYQPFKLVVRLSSIVLLGYMYLLGTVYTMFFKVLVTN